MRDKQLTPNFRLSEFITSPTAAQLGINNVPTEAQLRNIYMLAAYMQWIRNAIAKPITITSGFRSPALNRAVGGSPTSEHLTGLACDFRVQTMQPVAVINFLTTMRLPFDQIIEYAGHVHVGFRANPRGQVIRK